MPVDVTPTITLCAVQDRSPADPLVERMTPALAANGADTIPAASSTAILKFMSPSCFLIAIEPGHSYRGRIVRRKQYSSHPTKTIENQLHELCRPPVAQFTCKIYRRRAGTSPTG